MKPLIFQYNLMKGEIREPIYNTYTGFSVELVSVTAVKVLRPVDQLIYQMQMQRTTF